MITLDYDDANRNAHDEESIKHEFEFDNLYFKVSFRGISFGEILLTAHCCLVAEKDTDAVKNSIFAQGHLERKTGKYIMDGSGGYGYCINNRGKEHKDELKAWIEKYQQCDVKANGFMKSGKVIM